MEPATRDEIIAKAQIAERALEELEPYFRAVEAAYTEELIAISGWRAFWRGDRRRAEAANKIKALRLVRDSLARVVQAGRIAQAPKARGIV